MEKATVVLPMGATGNTVNMRRSPSTKADIIKRVPVGTMVNVISDEGKWCEIEFDGTIGYMVSDYLEYGDHANESNGAISEAELATISDALTQIENYINGIQKEVDLIGSITGRG